MVTGATTVWVSFSDIDGGRYVPLGVLVSRVRLGHNWTLEATARKAGIKVHNLRKVERGERLLTRVPAIMRLADALEIPRGQLFDWVVNEQEHRQARKEAAP